MADTFQYGLTYAGVPFLGDNGWTLAPDADGAQSPDSSAATELDRRMRPELLRDFSLPSYRQKSELDLQAPGDPDPSPNLQIGDWYYPCNAGRWSVFRGLMTSTMYKTALAATGGTQAATFTMKAAPVSPDNPNGVAGPYTLSTSMFMLPGRPLAEHGGGYDGVYLITLVDERYYWRGTPVSLTVRAWSTWDDLISDLGAALGVSVAYSTIEAVYGRPEPDSQLWCRSAPAPLLLDAVAANLGRVVVRRLDGSVRLLTYSESAAVASANRGPAKTVVRFAGGEIFSSGNVVKAGNLTPARNAVVPERVLVSFPKYVVGNDPVPHFLNARYQNPRPSAWVEDSYGSAHEVEVPAVSGLTGTGDYTIRSTAKALISGEADVSPFNLSGLEALAGRIAVDYYDSLALSALDEVYPGTFDWTAEGIHDVVWTYSAARQLATTRVMRRAWTDGVLDSQHATPPMSGQAVNPIGVGGRSVAQTWRDSYNDVVAATVLGSGPGPIQASDSYFILDTAGGFPTQTRWRARLENEIVLMEGTSGGVLRSLSGDYRVNVAFRGIDGTAAYAHGSGATLRQAVPNTTYGVNLVTMDKMTFCHPMGWTSGGVQEVKMVAQTQTVTATGGSGGGVQQGAVYLFPAVVNPYQAGDGQFTTQEAAYIVERASGIVFSGRRYDGQFVGYSYTSTPAPVYAVNGVIYSSGLSGTIDVVSNVCDDLFKINPGVNIAFDYSVPDEVTINSTVNGSGAIYSGNSSVTLTVQSAWGLILCYSESTMVLTLPDPNALTDEVTYTFKKTGPTGQAVQINSTAFIDGATSYSMSTQWDYVTVRPKAGRYYVVGNGF